jgi:serine/threonine protein kinase
MQQLCQLEISDLKDQLLSVKQRPFSRLPVCMLHDISKQIVGQSGRAGGQGTVYDVELWGEQLAAKLFRSDTDAHWLSELNSLTVLLHRNIVQIKYVIYDGVDDKAEQKPRGYVMERMHCSLYDYCKETKLQLEQIIAVLEQVALALAYTHAKKVAHMDIKPENILLDESKTVAKLCDFGCAHFTQTTLRSTLTLRGSQFFMAPEIIPDDVKSCNPFPVDVFAFGVTMWHLINPGANCKERKDCEWSRSPHVPPVVSELGRRCTNENPEERPTMKEVYEILKGMILNAHSSQDRSPANTTAQPNGRLQVDSLPRTANLLSPHTQPQCAQEHGAALSFSAAITSANFGGDTLGTSDATQKKQREEAAAAPKQVCDLCGNLYHFASMCLRYEEL